MQILPCIKILILPTKGNGFNSDKLLAAIVVFFCDSKRLLAMLACMGQKQ